MLKKLVDFKYIGKFWYKCDVLVKVMGWFQYGIDVLLLGMLVVVVQCVFMFGVCVCCVDSIEVLKVCGVCQVMIILMCFDVLGGNQEGVVVLVDDYWVVNKGCVVFKVEWDDSVFVDFDSG